MRRFKWIILFVSVCLVILSLSCGKDKKSPTGPSDGSETHEIQGITFVTIPGGSFRMGDIQNYGKYSDEKPVHDVTLSGFEMSIYEITQGQYEAITGSNPSHFSGSDDLPVEMVSWYDAVKFCNRLSEQMKYNKCYDESTWECDFSKNGFRLPTEAEWEYACRAGTETNYNTGNSESDLKRAGWYSANNEGWTSAVGQKEPNAWGLYDMHGNVWEWCNDRYGSYSSESQYNPTGAHSGSYRVYRGGGWFYDAPYCRSARRYNSRPDYSNLNIGFRVVRRPGGVTY